MQVSEEFKLLLAWYEIFTWKKEVERREPRRAPRGQQQQHTRSEGARTRCGRNYQQKSPHNLVVHRALGNPTSLKRAQCCEPNAAAALSSPGRAQLFVRTHRHPLAPPIRYCVVLDMYVPCTALAREYGARCVCGGGTLRLCELWRGPCTPPRYLIPT